LSDLWCLVWLHQLWARKPIAMLFPTWPHHHFWQLYFLYRIICYNVSFLIVCLLYASCKTLYYDKNNTHAHAQHIYANKHTHIHTHTHAHTLAHTLVHTHAGMHLRMRVCVCVSVRVCVCVCECVCACVFC